MWCMHTGCCVFLYRCSIGGHGHVIGRATLAMANKRTAVGFHRAPHLGGMWNHPLCVRYEYGKKKNEKEIKNEIRKMWNIFGDGGTVFAKIKKKKS